jgi:hypothetical protein
MDFAHAASCASGGALICLTTGPAKISPRDQRVQRLAERRVDARKIRRERVEDADSPAFQAWTIFIQREALERFGQRRLGRKGRHDEGNIRG